MTMATALKIPEIGESITEVQIAEWLKREGDAVQADEPLAVIDSEKTTFELPAPAGGRLVKILHEAGDTVKIGETVAEIEPDGKVENQAPDKAKAESNVKPESRQTGKAAAKKKEQPKVEEMGAGT